MAPIYFDDNASTPIDPAVAVAMRAFLDGIYGNPSIGHWASAPAKAALENARGKVAAFLGCASDEVAFTSGGSEANNLALKCLFSRRRDRPSPVITSQIENPATLERCRFLERLGAKVAYLRVDTSGLIDPGDIRRAITKDTFLISIMHANNEVGTIQPVAEVAKVAYLHGIPVRTEAAQSIGKIPAKVDELSAGLLSVGGRKVYAPKGGGAFHVRRGIKIEPPIHGAGHEGSRRAGPESALLKTALGMGREIAQSWIGMPDAQRLRDRFWKLLQTALGNQVVLNGHPERDLTNMLNVSFAGHVGGEILARIPHIAASTGPASHAGEIALSPVLLAVGVASKAGMGAIRFSLGGGMTQEEIEEVVSRLTQALA